MIDATLALRVLEALPHAVTVVDGAGKLAYANPAFWRDAGVPPEICPPGSALRDVVRLLAFRGFYGPGDPEARTEAVLAIDRSRTSRRQIGLPDGSRRFEALSVPLADGGFANISHEITPLLRAQERLSARASLLESTLAALQGGVARFDDSLRLGFFNASYEKLLGLPGGTLRPGMTHREVIGVLEERGEYLSTEEVEAAIARLERDRLSAASRHRERPSGSVLRFDSQPTPDGGFMLEVGDITALKRAEDEATRRAALLDSVLATMPHGVCLYGPDRRVRMFNAAYRRLMGDDQVAVGDLLDDTIMRRMAAGEYDLDTAAWVLKRFARAGSDEEALRRTRPNGTVLENKLARLPDGGVISVFTDVTALHGAQQAARERAELLDAVLEAMPDGVVVYGPDRRARQTNPAYRGMLGEAAVRIGESQEELAARHIAIGEQSRQDAEALVQRHLGPAEDAGNPIRRLRPNGTAIVTRAARLPDGGQIAVMTDITALHRAEEELRRRAAMQEAMLATIRHGIIMYGPDRRVLASNAKTHELLGTPPDHHLPGQLMDDLVDAQVARGQIDAAEAKRFMALDRRLSLNYTRHRPDGRVIDTVSEPTPDGGYVITYSDVTEERQIRADLERARAEAEAASEAKSRFLATMSHELRTPLGAVIGFSDAIATERDPARVAEYAAAVNEAGRHLLQLVDDILDVARSQTGALRVADQPFAPCRVLAAAMAEAAAEAQARGIALATCLPASLPMLRGDAGRLRQLLDKLVSNALKFTQAGGRVTLSAEGDAAGLAIRLADTGIGIPPGERERMFEPFTQLDSSLARRFQGSGLGLHLARTLALALGGTLTLEDPEGPGIVCLLRFPPARLVPAADTAEAGKLPA